MWNNPQGLKIQNLLILCTFFSRHSMALNKHVRHGMTLSMNSYLKMVFQEVLLIRLCSIKCLKMT